MMLEEEVEEIPEPEIKNRKDLHQSLERIVKVSDSGNTDTLVRS